MFKLVNFLILVFVLSCAIFYSIVEAKSYSDGALLRASGDIKVYLINNNTRRWITDIEVFNSYKLKWQDVKVVSKKEVSLVKEGAPIVLELTPILPSLAPTPIPSASVSATPLPVKINSKLPPPDYARADWLISHSTSNYGKIGQKIVFGYSDKEKDRIENFRLYEKKPGDKYFKKIAEFEQMLSTGCDDMDIDGEWMMTDAGQCGYWIIQRTTSPGGRGVLSYLAAANYSEGEYSYYVAGVDQDGAETSASPEAKLVFLTTVGVFSPADNEEISGVSPLFKWSIAGNWPKNSIPDYSIMISDSLNAQNPLWLKQVKVAEGKSDEFFAYNGPGLDSTKKYRVFIYGQYRQSEYDPDYISSPLIVPEFWIKSTSFRVSWIGALVGALLIRPLDFLKIF